MAHQSKLEALKEALKAADEEISHQKSLNTLLEMEVRPWKKAGHTGSVPSIFIRTYFLFLLA